MGQAADPLTSRRSTAMKTTAEARAVLRALEGQHPNANTELAYSNAFELLVATILSAQTTDVGVNLVTPALFRRYPDAAALAAAEAGELEAIIKSTGFFRQKARALIGMSQGLVATHGGRVPTTMEALVALPGVGRKTANVVLGHALGVAGLPVDRHVLRVANRIGLAASADPLVVEQQLGERLPPEQWIVASDTLILHGRRICKPKPLCDRCAVGGECEFFRRAAAAPPDPSTRPAAPRRTRAGPRRDALRAAPKRRGK
jgi:endonuclease-3